MSTIRNGREYALPCPEFRHILMIFGFSEPFLDTQEIVGKKSIKNLFPFFCYCISPFLLTDPSHKMKNVKKRMRRRSDERAKKEEKNFFLLSYLFKGVSVLFLWGKRRQSSRMKKRNLNSKDFFPMYLCVCVCKKDLSGLEKVKRDKGLDRYTALWLENGEKGSLIYQKVSFFLSS